MSPAGRERCKRTPRWGIWACTVFSNRNHFLPKPVVLVGHIKRLGQSLSEVSNTNCYFQSGCWQFYLLGQELEDFTDSLAVAVQELTVRIRHLEIHIFQFEHHFMHAATSSRKMLTYIQRTENNAGFTFVPRGRIVKTIDFKVFSATFDKKPSCQFHELGKLSTGNVQLCQSAACHLS